MLQSYSGLVNQRCRAVAEINLNSVQELKTTRQLSKINPYVGEFEGRRSVLRAFIAARRWRLQPFSMGGVGVRTPTFQGFLLVPLAYH
jgi:hypothetical protein